VGGAPVSIVQYTQPYWPETYPNGITFDMPGFGVGLDPPDGGSLKATIVVTNAYGSDTAENQLTILSGNNGQCL
jgi:hypothetical protein